MPVSVQSYAVLLLVFTLKHFIADFVLQNNFIARGKEAASGWAPALLFHILIHGVMTLAIVLAVAPRLWWLALVDFVVHGCIDRTKSLVTLRLQLKHDNPHFWWLLGFDQFLHQVTNIGLALYLGSA